MSQANQIQSNNPDNLDDCIFCKIIAKSIPAKIIYEDEYIMAFNDIAPKAPVHFLVIPKLHIVSMLNLQTQNLSHQQLMGHMLTTIPQIAQSQGLTAFKLLAHNGKQAMQEVMHMHIHVMGTP